MRHRVTKGKLPTGFRDARDLARESKFAEADAAQVKFAKITARAPTIFAAVPKPALEFRLFEFFGDFCSSCHVFKSLSLLTEGHAHVAEQSEAFGIRLCCGRNGDVHPFGFLDLVVIDFGEDQLISQPKRIVAAAIERLR